MMSRTTYLLILLLCTTIVTGISTDKSYYTPGEFIKIQHDGMLTVNTPDASYNLVGKATTSYYPASALGTYSVEDGTDTRTFQVVPEKQLYLRTRKAAASLQAADADGIYHVNIPSLGNAQIRATTTEIRITPTLGTRWGFTRTYAADPTNQGFERADIDIIAQGDSLYKCVDYDYFNEHCRGNWAFVMPLTPGMPYLLSIFGEDPAFGEGDGQSQPDSCSFSDDAGAGDGDSGVNCLTEVQTQNGGQTADLQDPEQGGGPSQIEINFTNSLSVASINAVNVTYRYQRQTNTEVAATTATIQVFDSGGWTTACTDTVTIGSWETYNCDLSTWVTTEAEVNNVQTRIQFDTAKQAKGDSEGTVWVDYSYLALDYVYLDSISPQYDNITGQPTSPTTYSLGRTYNFSVDWVDDGTIDEVNIEHNFLGSVQNSTLSGGPTYTHQTSLAAGTYSWKQIANDTSNNQNETPSQSYTVNRASGAVELLVNGVNGNTSINEDNTIAINGTRLFGEGTLILYENGGQIASGTEIDILRTYNTPGSYILTLNMSQTENYTFAEQEWNLTVNDTTPPATVTGPANISATTSSIYWTWTNPVDLDFSHVIVDVNGTWYANVSTPYVNVTGLSADSEYEIQLRTIDDIGNINQTYVNDTGKTKTSFDVTPPTIENVTNSSITDSKANITFDTNENADTLIKYGTTSGVYTETAYDATDVLAHNIQLTPLLPSQTYYYVVNSTDPAGNSAETTEYNFSTTADVTLPTYSGFLTTPASPQTHPVTIEINITWTDNGVLDEVQLEHNFTGTLQNSSMTSAGAGKYTYSVSPAAGLYTYRSIANDTLNNTNASMASNSYTVNRATGIVNLTMNGIDGNTAVDEDTSLPLNATRIAGEGTIELREEGLTIVQGTTQANLSKQYALPGTYLIQARLNETENYTYAQENHTLTINDVTPPTVTLDLPFDVTTQTQQDIQFSYTPDDNVDTQNCSIYINDTLNDTNTTISEEGINNFTINFPNGDYAWNVECRDAEGNAQNSSQRTFVVAFIYPWIPTTATHNIDGAVTATVNESDGTTSQIDLDEYIDVTAWSDSAPNNANITSLEASCEVDTAERGSILNFQYNTSGGWSADICPSSLDATGTFTCDLYAQGVDTVTELNALQVRCVERDGNGNPTSRASIDYMQLQPQWNLIELPDFNISDTDIQLPTGADEGQKIQLNATVRNNGSAGATVTVRFWDATRSVLINDTSATLASDTSQLVSVNWTAEIGRTQIDVYLDPSNTVNEENETNNNATSFIDINGWQVYYGSTNNKFRILSDSIAQNYNWSNDNFRGSVWAQDQDASVSMLNLQAITRTTTDTLAFNDLADMDTNLSMTGWTDSVNNTFSTGGAVTDTATFTIFGSTIDQVPIVNSTITNAFITGILYDVDDDTNGGYDGEEDIVFITKVNTSQAGQYGTYDYELRIPALLRQNVPNTDIIELYIEVT